ncbi:hypothetical protein EFT87_14485 [Schleiferilactobacillus harbinensis]|uniref:hypothetical protein n=1 Tax=Schleiferilactobacillus harbinensis TaxID=304207 RepID=UPI0021A7EDA7|nr:hypothetical protein [Schleiferilactobacillus harbinensis]MCT2909847.1 hypothetical protein [Schleiferilactobacillus harbinensis]
MTETVQNVFDDLLDSFKDLYSCDEFSYPGVADQEEAEYRERFAAALAAEKGSKSTRLAEKQKNCPYCHDPAEDDPASNLSDVIGTRMMIITHGTGAPYITTWDFNGSESKQISFCPMCGRRLEEQHC